MNLHRSRQVVGRSFAAAVVALALGLLALGRSAFVGAGEKEKGLPKGEKAPGIGRLMSPVGTLLVRPAKGKEWALPALYDAANADDELVALPGARAVLNVKEGDVRLSLIGGLPELSPTPVLESAAVLRNGDQTDLDVQLDRGRILIESRKEGGPARVRVRVRKTTVDLDLVGPGTVVAVELFGRWPAGTPFARKPKEGTGPETDLFFLVLKGRADVHLMGERHSVRAPAVYHWSSARGVAGPLPLQQTPAWLNPGADQSPDANKLHAAVERLRRSLAEKNVDGLKEAVTGGDDPLVRRVAVYSAGAVDDLPLVLDALADPKHPEARAAAVATLTHYIGRGTEYDVRVYEAMLKRKYSPGEGEIVMYLLHGFRPRDTFQPETYETLISYLLHDRLAVRQLAAAHLYRLVPQGKAIPYDPAAGPKERERAHDAWNKLVPQGELPPRVQGKEGNE